MRWHGGVRFCELCERRRRQALHGNLADAPRLSHDGYTNMSGGITPRTCDGGGVTPYMPNSPPCTHTPTGHTLSYTIVSAISLQEYTSSRSIWKVWRRDTSGRPHIATRTRPELGGRLTTPRRSPHAQRLAAQRSNVLELHRALTTADGNTARRSKLVEHGGARSWE